MHLYLYWLLMELAQSIAYYYFLKTVVINLWVEMFVYTFLTCLVNGNITTPSTAVLFEVCHKKPKLITINNL